jgi:hypothetical protein
LRERGSLELAQQHAAAYMDRLAGAGVDVRLEPYSA